MAELNLNFHKNIGRHNPTKNEIVQIESVAVSIESIIKALNAYADGNHRDIDVVCMGVCNAMELLIDPVIEYLSNYAGDAPTTEKTEGETA